MLVPSSRTEICSRKTCSVLCMWRLANISQRFVERVLVRNGDALQLWDVVRVPLICVEVRLIVQQVFLRLLERREPLQEWKTKGECEHSAYLTAFCSRVDMILYVRYWPDEAGLWVLHLSHSLSSLSGESSLCSCLQSGPNNIDTNINVSFFSCCLKVINTNQKCCFTWLVLWWPLASREFQVV